MALLDGTNAPTISVEFDFGWRSNFILGISTLGGSDTLGSQTGINWQAIASTDIRSISIRRGRTREDQTNQPGQLTLLLDNLSGNYDPDNPSSTYQYLGYSTLTRGMGIRVKATYSGTTEIIYVGFVEQINTDISLDPTVTFIATDALAILAARSVPSIASQYSGDTTSIRIGRVLDQISWSTADRNLSGSRTMQPTIWGQSALALCEEAARCEFGRFYVSKSGAITLTPYENLKTTTLRYSLSDTRSSSTIEYDTIVSDPGSRFLVNQCVLTQATGLTQTYDEVASEGRFGTYTRLISAPLLDNSVAATMASYYAKRTAYPSTRIDRIEFDGIGAGSIWSSIIATDLGDRVNVARTTVDGRSLSYTNLIESLNYDITPNSWRVSMDLSPSTF